MNIMRIKVNNIEGTSEFYQTKKSLEKFCKEYLSQEKYKDWILRKFFPLIGIINFKKGEQLK